jgi:hypothetical protein
VLKLNCDVPLSKFAFKFKLRRYIKVLALRLETLTAAPGVEIVAANDLGKGLFFIRFGRAGVSTRTQTVMTAAEAMTGLDAGAYTRPHLSST